jgi:hypothetical protein
LALRRDRKNQPVTSAVSIIQSPRPVPPGCGHPGRRSQKSVAHGMIAQIFLRQYRVPRKILSLTPNRNLKV